MVHCYKNVMDSSGEKVKPYKGEVSGSATDAHHGLDHQSIVFHVRDSDQC